MPESDATHCYANVLVNQSLIVQEDLSASETRFMHWEGAGSGAGGLVRFAYRYDP